MATLGSEIRFCSVKPTAFLGLSQGRTKNEVVVSNTNTTVTIYEMKDHRAITNFNTRRPRTLAAPVVYSSKQGRYVAALQNNELMVWTEDDANICKGKKIKVLQEIDSLWSPSVRSDPLIISKNGAIERLTDSNKTNVVVEATDDAARVSFVDVLYCGDLIHVAFVSIAEQNDVSCHHFVIVQSETYELREHYRSSLPMSNFTMLKGLCLVCSPDDGQVNLLLLGADGQLHTGVNETKGSHFKWSSHKLNDSFDETKLVAMIPLKSHVVVALQNNKGDISCTVYNVKYGAPTHNKVVKGSKKQTLLKFYKVHDNLMLLGGEDLYLIPYSYESVQLAQVLGTRQNVRCNGNEVVKKTQNLIWTSTGLEQEPEHKDLNRTMHDAHFSNAFIKFVTDIESSGAVHHETCSQAFTELTKAHKFEMLGEALAYYKNVPETTLVNVLASYLSYEDERNHLLRSYDFDKSGMWEAQLLPLVDQILTVPINDVFLQEHVRRLPFDHVIFLLNYLHSFLKCFCHLNESDWTKVTKFVEWISILVDAHFHYLIVMKNDAVHSFLRDLQSTVVNQCEILECLGKIQELMWIAKSRGKLNDVKTNNGYGIETLNFV